MLSSPGTALLYNNPFYFEETISFFLFGNRVGMVSIPPPKKRTCCGPLLVRFSFAVGILFCPHRMVTAAIDIVEDRGKLCFFFKPVVLCAVFSLMSWLAGGHGLIGCSNGSLRSSDWLVLLVGLTRPLVGQLDSLCGLLVARMLG